MVTYINTQLEDSNEKFRQALINSLKSVNKAYDEVCVVCIGTDRSTGDSLGPLVGHKLSDSNINVIGNLDNPVHANNLDVVSTIPDNTLVVAVDASLGSIDHIGHITVGIGPIKPGAGVNKVLPEVGDISITGIVNIGGFAEFIILQNTRLSLVMKMADIIADGIQAVIEESLLQIKKTSCTTSKLANKIT